MWTPPRRGSRTPPVQVKREQQSRPVSRFLYTNRDTTRTGYFSLPPPSLLPPSPFSLKGSKPPSMAPAADPPPCCSEAAWHAHAALPPDWQEGLHTPQTSCVMKLWNRQWQRTEIKTLPIVFASSRELHLQRRILSLKTENPCCQSANFRVNLNSILRGLRLGGITYIQMVQIAKQCFAVM